MPAINITDLNNAKLDVDHIAAISNSTAATTTDRIGNTKKTIAGLSAQFVNAGVYASTTTGLAATSNGQYFSAIAAESNSYLILYLNNAGAAIEQKRYPATAYITDATQLHASETAGRALVADGAIFKVQGTGTVSAYEYRRVNAGTVSTLIETYPGFSAIDGVDAPQGIYPATDGNSGTGNGLSLFSQQPISSSGILTGVSVFMSVASVGALLVASINSDGSLKLEASQKVILNVGVNTFTNFNLFVKAGWLIGVYADAGIRCTSPNGSSPAVWYCSGIPSTATPKSAAGITVQLGWSVKTGILGAQASIVLQTSLIAGTSINQGQTPAVFLGNLLTPGYTAFNLNPVSQDGVISAISIYIGATAGAGRLVVANKDSSDNFIVVSSRAYNFLAGLNSISDWNPTVIAGQYIGVYTQIVDGITYGTSGGTGALFVAGIPFISTPSGSIGPSSRVGIGFQVSSGFLRNIVAEKSLEIIKTGSNDGKGLLFAADNTGIADSTAAFLAAYITHPNPYVPPGIYAVTALPNKGDRFYGNGRINVNGTRYPLPLCPQDLGLLLTARARHARAVSDGSALILLADSIGAHFNATSLNTHWFNRYERWVNDIVSPGGEVATVVVRDDVVGSTGETALFYGLTVSGGSNGSGGPVGRSVILAAGGYIELTGNYAFVDAYYQQQAGAGSLVFTFNSGASYKTVGAAGTTQLDKFTGPSATGQAASGVYRITATGAAVEITGITRQSSLITTAGTPNRLNCMRMSYGGTQALDITDARVDAVLAQANGIGGGASHEVYIGLGTNDMLFGASPAAYEINMQRIMNRLLAGGVTKIRALSPIRMHYLTWAQYLGSANKFDQYVAALVKVCAVNNIPLLRFDAIDFFGRNLLSSDGLHPNDAGFDVMFDMIARWDAA